MSFLLSIVSCLECLQQLLHFVWIERTNGRTLARTKCTKKANRADKIVIILRVSDVYNQILWECRLDHFKCCFPFLCLYLYVFSFRYLLLFSSNKQICCQELGALFINVKSMVDEIGVRSTANTRHKIVQ